MSTFIISPLPAGEVDTRAAASTSKVADGPLPCRRCLRNAEAGDELVLAPYDPFTVRSPYAGDGPVYVHAGGCEPFEPAPGAVSEQVTGRALSVRAYDEDAMMTSSTVSEGERFAQHADQLLAGGGRCLSPRALRRPRLLRVPCRPGVRRSCPDGLRRGSRHSHPRADRRRR